MRTKQHSSQRTVPRSNILALAVIILFSCSNKTLAQQWNTNGNDISNTNTGNVGIGTTSPAQKLEISSVSPLIQQSDAGAGGVKITIGTAAGFFGFSANRNFATGSHYDTGKTTASYYMFVGNGQSHHGWATTPTNNAEPIERMRLDKLGNLGIGTVIPAYRLDVVGQVNASGGFCIAGDCKNAWSQVSGIPSVFGRTGAVVAAANDYTWAQINKATSSLGDIAVRSASDLNAGMVPLARLGASGTPDASTFLRGDNTWATVPSSQWTTGTNNISYNGGNVGIGTTSPQRTLDLGTSGQLTFGNNGFSSTGAPGFFWYQDNSTYGIYKSAGVWSAPNYQQLTLSFLTGIVIDGGYEHGRSGTVLQPNGGKVGIGTTTPAFKLDVNGEINATGLRINGIPISTGPSGPITWAQVDKSTSSLLDITTRNAGHLNAGTVPLAQLGLSGNASVSTFLRGDNTWAAVPSSQWTSGTNSISYSAGNVGIGTTTPTSIFTTFQAPLNDATNRVGNYLFMESRNNTGSNIANTHTVLSVEGSTNNGFTWNGQIGVKSTVGTNWGGITDAVAFYASGRTQLNFHSISNLHNFFAASPSVVANSSISNSFGLYLAAQKAPNVINGYGVYQAGASDLNYFAGSVGIGTAPSSQYKVDINGNTNVTGNLNVTGNINAKYQDVAEWVESSQELLAGTLVVLDHTKSNQVIASSQAYDTRVAGVISERPGIALGETGDNKVLVATTGRVRLTVDASKGPIQIGDLLVTSEIPGVAMKSEAINVGGVQIHRPGTLVGKALEPLAKGQGKILVLLSLQ